MSSDRVHNPKTGRYEDPADAWTASGPLPKRSKLVDAGDLEDLQELLERHGPEPVGFVIKLDEAGLEQLPGEWRVERIVNVDGAWRPHHTIVELEEGHDEI